MYGLTDSKCSVCWLLLILNAQCFLFYFIFRLIFPGEKIYDKEDFV